MLTERRHEPVEKLGQATKGSCATAGTFGKLASNWEVAVVVAEVNSKTLPLLKGTTFVAIPPKRGGKWSPPTEGVGVGRIG